jgi:hypothetical protein
MIDLKWINKNKKRLPVFSSMKYQLTKKLFLAIYLYWDFNG